MQFEFDRFLTCGTIGLLVRNQEKIALPVGFFSLYPSGTPSRIRISPGSLASTSHRNPRRTLEAWPPPAVPASSPRTRGRPDKDRTGVQRRWTCLRSAIGRRRKRLPSDRRGRRPDVVARARDRRRRPVPGTLLPLVGDTSTSASCTTASIARRDIGHADLREPRRRLLQVCREQPLHVSESNGSRPVSISNSITPTE